MANIIHIVNGDNTKSILEQSGLEGDIIVWRELLCDGPVTKPLFSDEFWQARYNYFEKEFGVSRLEYFDKTIKELLRAEFLEDIDEVVLWFEYDLFCQVNLMALCSFLLEHFRKDVIYSMVCVGREKDRDGWQTLADYTPSEYKELYKNSINMSRASFEYADECWKVYSKKDKDALQNFNFGKNKRFRYFHVAMQQEQERFADENGFNQIDRKILEFLKEGKYSFKEIVKLLLIWQQTETVYGFGDVQYANRIQSLDKYYQEKNGILELNSDEKKILSD